MNDCQQWCAPEIYSHHLYCHNSQGLFVYFQSPQCPLSLRHMVRLVYGKHFFTHAHTTLYNCVDGMTGSRTICEDIIKLLKTPNGALVEVKW